MTVIKIYHKRKLRKEIKEALKIAFVSILGATFLLMMLALAVLQTAERIS